VLNLQTIIIFQTIWSSLAHLHCCLLKGGASAWLLRFDDVAGVVKTDILQ